MEISGMCNELGGGSENETGNTGGVVSDCAAEGHAFLFGHLEFECI